MIRDIEAKSASTRIVKGDDVGFGDYIAVWAPVLDKNGNVIAMVEADYCITDLQNNINNYMFKVILFLMAAIVIITIMEQN